MKEVTFFLLSSDRGSETSNSDSLPNRPLCRLSACGHLVQAAVSAGVKDIRVLKSPTAPLCEDEQLKAVDLSELTNTDTADTIIFLDVSLPTLSATTITQLIETFTLDPAKIAVAENSDEEALPFSIWQKKTLESTTLNTPADLFPANSASLIIQNETDTVNVIDYATWAQANGILQQRIQANLMQSGVHIVDPNSTYIEAGASIGQGTTINPFTVIMSGVSVGEECEVGPFSHLRVGAKLENKAEVGNFTEMKNSTLGERSKAKHLTYLGDANIGKKVNIGAGTITANYDGKNKHKTEIADNAFIGSGSILVAPLKVGDSAITGAGAVVLKNNHVSTNQIVVGVPAKPKDKRKEQ